MRCVAVVVVGLLAAAVSARAESIDVDGLVAERLKPHLARIFQDTQGSAMPPGTTTTIKFEGQAVSDVPVWKAGINKLPPTILIVKDSNFVNCGDRQNQSRMSVSQTTSHTDWWSSTDKVRTEAKLVVTYRNPVVTAEASVSTVNEQEYNKGTGTTRLVGWNDAQDVVLDAHKVVRVQFTATEERAKIDFTRRWELHGTATVSFTIPGGGGGAFEWSQTFPAKHPVTYTGTTGPTIGKVYHLCAIDSYEAGAPPRIGWSIEGGPWGHGPCVVASRDDDGFRRQVPQVVWLGVGDGRKVEWVKGLAPNAVNYKGVTVCRNPEQSAEQDHIKGWPLFGGVMLLAGETRGGRDACYFSIPMVFLGMVRTYDFYTLSQATLKEATATIPLEKYLSQADRTFELRGSVDNVQQITGAMIISQERSTTNRDCQQQQQPVAQGASGASPLDRRSVPQSSGGLLEIANPNPGAERPMSPAEVRARLPVAPPKPIPARR
jgi:hypothetical protein